MKSKNWIWKLSFSLTFCVSAFILFINLRLYSCNFSDSQKKEDIEKQLNFIGGELRGNNLGDRMQEIFPEGFMFTNALYGLSWCELALADSGNNTKFKKRALNEALFAYNEISSYKAKMPFDEELEPQYGIYYAGWNNYLLSKILLLDTLFEDYKKFKTLFIHQTSSIADAVSKNGSPYLPSYSGQAWPADMCVAMASMRNYEKLYGPSFGNTLTEWIERVRLTTDPKTKLIPHKAHAETGEVAEGTRGCSISLIIRFLSEIDRSFANEQYLLFKEKFVTTTFGLPSVREFPKGQSGEGDIDSGPVIFGTGFSGTIVSIGTFSILGDSTLAEQQYKTINAFGFEWNTKNKKKYLFGQMPVADAFIAWGRATALHYKDQGQQIKTFWRVKFHLSSVLFSGALWFLLYFKTILNGLKGLVARFKLKES